MSNESARRKYADRCPFDCTNWSDCTCENTYKAGKVPFFGTADDVARLIEGHLTPEQVDGVRAELEGISSMSEVWIVEYDDHCPDPARYVAGVFTSEEKAKAFVATKVERSVASVPSNYPEYLRRPSYYESMYEIERAEMDPEP